MRHVLATLGLFASAATGGAALAADYEKAVVDSVASYAAPKAFDGVTINVACRRLPAMDFISGHKEIFESATGAKIQFTNYPEKRSAASRSIASTTTTSRCSLPTNGWRSSIPRSSRPTSWTTCSTA
jgi:hypothetical protein